jgi:hypothetical protein
MKRALYVLFLCLAMAMLGMAIYFIWPHCVPSQVPELNPKASCADFQRQFVYALLGSLVLGVVSLLIFDRAMVRAQGDNSPMTYLLWRRALFPATRPRSQRVP